MTDKTRRLAAWVEEYGRTRPGAIGVFPDEPMCRHTTFRIGGPAELFLLPGSAEAFADLLAAAKEAGTRIFLLGRGSNVLFDDAGFPGAVICMSGLDGIRVEGDLLKAEAGAMLSQVCKAARDASLAGLEFAYGIPGSVGGAVAMDAGAYGGEIRDVLASSLAYDLGTGEFRTLSPEEHRFGSRDSAYRHDGIVCVSAAFRLKPGESDEIAALMTDIMNRRTSKQPLEFPSAGSVFKRPEGHFVGQMVEESGLKGTRIGGAEVSEKHAGFIVNRGGATSADVLNLVEHIKEVVLRNYGVELECEIIHVV